MLKFSFDLKFLKVDSTFFTKLIKENYDSNRKIFFFGLLSGSKTAFSSGEMTEREVEIEVNINDERRGTEDFSPMRKISIVKPKPSPSKDMRRSIYLGLKQDFKRTLNVKDYQISNNKEEAMYFVESFWDCID